MELDNVPVQKGDLLWVSITSLHTSVHNFTEVGLLARNSNGACTQRGTPTALHHDELQLDALLCLPPFALPSLPGLAIICCAFVCLPCHECQQL